MHNIRLPTPMFSSPYGVALRTRQNNLAGKLTSHTLVCAHAASLRSADDSASPDVFVNGTQTGALWIVERARISSGTPRAKQHESQAAWLLDTGMQHKRAARRMSRLKDAPSRPSCIAHRGRIQLRVAR